MLLSTLVCFQDYMLFVLFLFQLSDFMCLLTFSFVQNTFLCFLDIPFTLLVPFLSPSSSLLSFCLFLGIYWQCLPCCFSTVYIKILSHDLKDCSFLVAKVLLNACLVYCQWGHTGHYLQGNFTNDILINTGCWFLKFVSDGGLILNS